MRPLSRRSRQLPLAGEPMAVACGAVLFASPAKGRWGRRAAHGSVGSRFFRNPSVSGADSSPWQGSQGRSTWQGRQWLSQCGFLLPHQYTRTLQGNSYSLRYSVCAEPSSHNAQEQQCVRHLLPALPARSAANRQALSRVSPWSNKNRQHS